MKKSFLFIFTLIVLFLLFSFNKINILKPCEIINYNLDSIDSLYISNIKTDTGFKITLNNNSKDTLYLFSSYLNKRYMKSKYLHRIDKKNKVKKMSFLPLVPFLSTKHSDLSIITEEALVNKHQINYEFITILPSKEYVFEILNDEIYTNEFTEEVTLSDFHINSKLSLKPFNNTMCNNIKQFDNVIEFAIYDDVKIFQKEEDYFLDQFTFNQKAKEYKIIKTILGK